jgi:uncharacterized membrane protein YphA (DoxX/SURF4 family)
MQRFIRVIQWLVGITFVISGLIKLIDPIGFSYKLIEYFHVFGWGCTSGLALLLSVLLCVVEVLAGLALLLGYQPRKVTSILFVTIIFFTFLTGLTYLSGYINPAMYRPELGEQAVNTSWFQSFQEDDMLVSDCGCFGDALPLHPKTSFIKDVILFILISFLLKNNGRIKLLTTQNASRNGVVIGGFISIFFALYSINFLPIIDFRPYKKGNNISQLMRIPEGAPTDSSVIIFKYRNKKSGYIQNFNLMEIPNDSLWEYVDREDKVIRKGYRPPIHDFQAIDALGKDRTQDLLQSEKVLLIISYDVQEADVVDFKKFKYLTPLQKKGYSIYIWTSSLSRNIAVMKKETNLPFEVLMGDRTLLKTIIRSNPGLTLLKKGTVIQHWHHHDLPSLTEIEK